MTFKIQAAKRIEATQKTMDSSLKHALEKAKIEFTDESRKWLTSCAAVSGRKIEPKVPAAALKEAGYKVTEISPDKFYVMIGRDRYKISYNNKYYTTYIMRDEPEED